MIELPKSGQQNQLKKQNTINNKAFNPGKTSECSIHPNNTGLNNVKYEPVQK